MFFFKVAFLSFFFVQTAFAYEEKRDFQDNIENCLIKLGHAVEDFNEAKTGNYSKIMGLKHYYTVVDSKTEKLLLMSSYFVLENKFIYSAEAEGPKCTIQEIKLSERRDPDIPAP